MKPLVSIVLCTYNNADSLQLTLNQLTQQQRYTAEDIEIIVVNNNSPDHTEAVVKPFLLLQNLRVVYLHESRQGLSHARNTGVNNAKGSYILFTDDDADIPSDWVSEYLKVIQQYQPDCLYSKIQIIWDQTKPWWFIPEYTPFFVGLDYGDTLIEVNDIHKEFFGKNFCVRKELLQELGGFDPQLGRRGEQLMAGEETLIYRKLVETKKSVIYFPNAGVGHRLKPREYTSANIQKLFIDGAYSSLRIAKLTARKKILGRPLRILIDAGMNMTKSIFKFSINALIFKKAESYYHYLCIRKNFTLIKLWILAS